MTKEAENEYKKMRMRQGEMLVVRNGDKHFRFAAVFEGAVLDQVESAIKPLDCQVGQTVAPKRNVSALLKRLEVIHAAEQKFLRVVDNVEAQICAIQFVAQRH